MLKGYSGVEVERQALERAKILLAGVPFLKIENVNHEFSEPSCEGQVDFLLQLRVHGRSHRLIFEVKQNGQPRHIRLAAAQLRNFIDPKQRDAYGVIVAPYLSPAAQKICQEQDIGFLDFEGNCRLVFDNVYIERVVPLKPSTARRELKSIFAAKSAQALRVLLRDETRVWKIADLAKAARISLGHASNVRSALIDREWANVGPEGLHLINPDALLDAWRDAYSGPLGHRLGFYTVLHGSSLQERLPKILEDANRNGAAMLASFSAAQWLAPYARTTTHYFYADEEGLTILRNRLDLSSPARGENVVVMQIKNNGLFQDSVEPAPNLRCTSPVQTYLDLYTAGERGREAAEHLRMERLKWRKK